MPQKIIDLQVESRRLDFSTGRLVEFVNINWAKRTKLESKKAQPRIERALERIKRARQDVAALLHLIDPDEYPHPGDPGAVHYYGFPRETKKEAP